MEKAKREIITLKGVSKAEKNKKGEVRIYRTIEDEEILYYKDSVRGYLIREPFDKGDAPLISQVRKKNYEGLKFMKVKNKLKVIPDTELVDPKEEITLESSIRGLKKYEEDKKKNNLSFFVFNLKRNETIAFVDIRFDDFEEGGIIKFIFLNNSKEKVQEIIKNYIYSFLKENWILKRNIREYVKDLKQSKGYYLKPVQI